MCCIRVSSRRSPMHRWGADSGGLPDSPPQGAGRRASLGRRFTRASPGGLGLHSFKFPPTADNGVGVEGSMHASGECCSTYRFGVVTSHVLRYIQQAAQVFPDGSSQRVTHSLLCPLLCRSSCQSCVLDQECAPLGRMRS